MIENIKASLKDAQDALARLLSNEAPLLKIESAAKILIETFEKGFFGYIRIYGLEQEYFDKTWKPSDLEKVK